MTHDEELREYQAGKEHSADAAAIAFACTLILAVIAAIWAIV